MIENKYGVKEIVMCPAAVCFCPLGKDWYKNKLSITMCPDKRIPDYCEVEEWFDTHIRGKSLIIEDVLSQVYEYITHTYEPKALEVISRVDDAKHFPVEVKK